MWWSYVVLIERLSHVLIDSEVLFESDVKQVAACHHVDETWKAQTGLFGRLCRIVLVDELLGFFSIDFHVLLPFQQKHQLTGRQRRTVGFSVAGQRK